MSFKNWNLAHRKLYDISVSLGGESIDYPGDPPYQRKTVQALKNGDACNLSAVAMSVHAGTHMDAPAHLLENGWAIDQFPLERFFLSAFVVDIKNSVEIEPGELERVDVGPGAAVLFKTRNSREGLSHSGLFEENFVYLSEKGVDWCLQKEVALVGIDYISIEKYESEGLRVHRRLLGNDILILEGINLADVPAGIYELICFPLKIRGAEGAPVRAVLMG